LLASTIGATVALDLELKPWDVSFAVHVRERV